MLRKGVNKFRGYVVRRIAEASIIRSRLRVSRWKSASLRRGRRCEGEARVGFTSLTALEAPWPQQRGPDTSSCARETRSHIVVRYADLDLRRLNHSAPTRYAARVRTNVYDLPTGFFRSRRLKHFVDHRQRIHISRQKAS